MLLIGALFAASLLYSSPAAAQATRTWISGVGDDANPCSRTAPCKTFAGAISKTATGGEIDCLDPGGFGTVTITKSITFDCRETEGSILASGTTGINVNGANAVVILRGLAINGAGTTPGTYGVHIFQAQSVTIEDSYIFGFGSGSARGISVDGTTSNVQLFVNNSTINNNTGGGIVVQPGSGYTAGLELHNVRLLNNGVTGLAVSTASGGTAIVATVVDSEIAGGGTAGASGVVAKALTGTATILIKSSSISGNPIYGINSNGAGAAVRVGGTAITNNGTALNSANSAKLESFGDNDVTANSNPGAFTATIPHS
ncbi:MAG: hypothetical protein ACTHJR_09275 [Sphingomonas sp.]|uniref:hypothetical protein n=1 Tax=Sphingomonas sp. TaxID=28214 RepID=UPI003F81637A